MTEGRLDLSKVGGEKGDYVTKPWFIKPFREVRVPNAAVKLYSKTSAPQKQFSRDTMHTVEDLVGDMLTRGKIDPRLGLGFAIVSNGYINVSMWGGVYPSLLNPTLFGFDKPENMKETIRPLSIKKEGVYCVWELGVVTYETEAWKRYLKSEKRAKDKLEYIGDRFEGIVS